MGCCSSTPAKEKLFDGDGKAPPGIEKQFEGHLRGHVPRPHRSKHVLLVGLSLALLTFACLSFGQTSTGNNEGTASLYTYFGVTAVVIGLVLLLLPPPNRPRA